MSSKRKELKEESPDHARKILKTKNLKLFAELVVESGSPDVNLWRDIAKGFNLIWRYFPGKAPACDARPSQVREMAPIARDATWSSVRRGKDDTLCKEIYASALDECSRGWMRGPFDLESLPEGAVLTRRFGVEQTSTLADGSRVQKFRPIHDFTESLINITNSCPETILPMGVDQICSSLVSRMRSRPNEKMVSKAIDLRKAYKNLPLSAEALVDSYICVCSPETGNPQAFQTLVLPFGARSAVMGFCRTWYAIWRIGVVVFNLHWTVYFDDYYLVAEVAEAKHVEMAQHLS
eukprot:s386_g10.t1